MRGHDLDPARAGGWAAHYEFKDGVDFNKAPEADFYGAPIGRSLAELAKGSAAFAPFQESLDEALGAPDYAELDSMIAECLRNGAVTDARGASMHPSWRRYAERLEGLNVALSRGSKRAGERTGSCGALAKSTTIGEGGGEGPATCRTGRPPPGGCPTSS